MPPSPRTVNAEALPKASEIAAGLPLSFEINRGQSDARVKFLSRGKGYNLFLTPDEAVLALKKPGRRGAGDEARKSSLAGVLRLSFAGGNPAPEVSGQDELPGVSNYYTGADRSKWVTDVAHFGRVRYAGVYEGVDAVFYGNQGQLEYDFVVAPGADPRPITLSFAGADEVRIEGGELVLRVGESEVRQHRPVVYQEAEGGRREVEGRYVMRGRHEVGFELGAYDATKTLVIDPVLVYSTYLGGTGQDEAIAVETDAAGNIYLTGEAGANFPTVNPAGQPNATSFGDAFVTKLNAAGNALIYSTYLASTDFKSVTVGRDIAVDAAGNAYVVGQTDGKGFPTVNAIQPAPGQFAADAWVAKLSPTGALLYSTYLGGNSSDSGTGIGVDAAGNAHVALLSASTDMPTSADAFQKVKSTANDIYYAKINAAGSAILYSTFLGGNQSDFSRGLAVDAAGNAYVTGYTNSTNFPTKNAVQPAKNAADAANLDVFVAKINPNAAGPASLVYSTYLGGDKDDTVGTSGTAAITNGLAVDQYGNAYVVGRTYSPNFPTVGAAQPAKGATARAASSDAFLTKLGPDGSQIVYSTFLGGAGDEAAFGVAVNVVGNAYVTGEVNAESGTDNSFPLVNEIPPVTKRGNIFATKFNPAGSQIVYSTRLSNSSGGEGGRAVALDAAGNAHLAGTSNSGGGFVTTPDAFQKTTGGGFDAYMSIVSDPTIIGRVTDEDGNGVSGATVTLTGTLAAVVQTNFDGYYTFGILTPGGNYTVSASKAGFSFLPESRTFNNLQRNQVANFSSHSLIQFGSAVYNATEGTHKSVQVTVQRTGGLNQAMTVFYETVNQSASDQGDYTTALGTLRFAAGEATKQFTVFIIDDTYDEPAETLSLVLSKPSRGELGPQSTAALTINDNDAASGASPVKEEAFNSEFFVRQHYLDFFNREPDQPGLDFWKGQIDSCGADAACREVRKINVSAAFFLSIEFQETGYLVYLYNQAAYNTGEHQQLRAFLADTQEIGRGVVIGQQGWQQQLEQNKAAYAETFAARQSFTDAYPLTLTPTQYVDALNANTGNSLAPDKRGSLIIRLGNGQISRAQALREIVEDAEFQRRQKNRAFVLMQYFGYMRREPDQLGFDFWLGKLNNHNGDYISAEMVKAFINSGEYFGRFGQ